MPAWHGIRWRSTPFERDRRAADRGLSARRKGARIMSRTNTTVRRLASAGLALLTGVTMVSLVEAGQQAQQQERQQMQSIQGVVEDVDPEAKALMVRPSEGPTQRILYTDETKVTGARDGVAGLAAADGRQVIVQFTMQGASRVAASIELMPER
jgi:hypothetical protein